jgi:hypothetical protein
VVWEWSAAASIVLVWRGAGIASVAPVRCNEVRLNVGPGTLWLMYGGIEGLSSSDLDSQGMKGGNPLETGKVRESTIKPLGRHSP